MKTVFFIGGSSMYDDIQTATLEECVEYCKQKDILGCDTETEGFDYLVKKLLMFQIGDEEKQFVIDTRIHSIRPLKEILETKTIIFHNAKFDYKFIKHWAGIGVKKVYDTFLAEKCLYNGKDIKYGLKDLCERYLGVELDKSQRNQFVGLTGQPFTHSQINYGAKDVEYLVKLHRLQQPAIQQKGLEELVERENKLVIVLSKMEMQGMELDTVEWKNLARQQKIEANKKFQELDAEVVKQFPELQSGVQFDMFSDNQRQSSINWKSPTQVLKVFQRIVDIDNVNGKELTKHRHHALIDKYIKYKEYTKKTDAYGDAFLDYIKSDGKIHTTFNQILETGRMSSSNPNMQQIPGDYDFQKKIYPYRNCFVAPKGWVFVSSDYSSQELCIIAHGSQEPVWLEALKNNQDLHSVCAELIFKEKWKDGAEDGCSFYMNNQKLKCECAEHKKLRTTAKTINFG